MTVVQEVDKDNFKLLETLKTNPGVGGAKGWVSHFPVPST